MHVEPLDSVREFLSHYAMIVLSILTALAQAQVALGMEHRHEGARAREEIEQEISSNRKAVDEALQFDTGQQEGMGGAGHPDHRRRARGTEHRRGPGGDAEAGLRRLALTCVRSTRRRAAES